MDVVSQCRRLWNRAPPLGSYLPQDASGSEQQCDRCHVFRFMVFTTGVGLIFSLGSLPIQSGNFLEFFSLRVGEQAAGVVSVGQQWTPRPFPVTLVDPRPIDTLDSHRIR